MRVCKLLGFKNAYINFMKIKNRKKANVGIQLVIMILV